MESKILEKIQALFNMAEHANSNEHEAAIALERAQALLLQHNLTRADIIDTDNETPQGIGKIERTESNGYTWKRAMANVLASSNLCKVIGYPHAKKWSLFGSYDNVKAVLEMYDWIIPQLTWLATKGYREYKNDDGTERGQTWKASFYMGAIIAIKNRLAKPIEDFAQGAGHALVIANKAMLSTAIHKIYPHLTKGRGFSTRGRDGAAAGSAAGNGMQLTPQRRLNNGTLLLK